MNNSRWRRPRTQNLRGYLAKPGLERLCGWLSQNILDVSKIESGRWSAAGSLSRKAIVGHGNIFEPNM